MGKKSPLRDRLTGIVFIAVLGLWIGSLTGDLHGAQAWPRTQPFDEGWRFHRGDAPGAEAPGFDDSAWRTVDTPNDWSIEDLPALATSEKAEARLDLSRGTWRFKAGDDPNWRAADLDDAAWRTVLTPANWEEHGQSRDDNVYGWYRRRIDVPAESRGKDLLIDLGSIDDCDEAFVNGERVGGTGTFPPNYASAYDQPRLYTIPARVLRADGTDLIAVRVFDGPGNGGLNGATAPAIRIGPFDGRASQGQASTGWVVGGTGWYRRHFGLDGLGADRRVEVLFDGVYMDADVWLNGQHLGGHPYGYTSFSMDLTPHLNRGGDNVLAVRVCNEGKNSRWYSGSGIFRHVWLTTTGPVYIPTWGLFVTTPSVSEREATAVTRVDLANAGQAAAEVMAQVRLLDPRGRTVAKGETRGTVGEGGRTTLTVESHVARPRLWSPATPVLYRAVAEVRIAGRVVDRCETPFGIRTVEVDADKGLRINGEPIELKGGCVHHDNGILGSAAINRAEEWRVERMKAAGYNAIRTSHNPPSGAFLDACDRLGILVMDEAFDHWQEQKNPQDYHRFFKDWWERDIASMVLRDRNHPSVILWSIGNEIIERDEPSGPILARQLGAAVKALDPTRPVTEALCSSWKGRPWTVMDPHFAALDVGGYNYQWGRYEADHGRFPQRIMAGTESFPIEAFENWDQVLRHPYVIGDFVWTAYDYLGESGIGRSWIEGQESGGFTGSWPWHIAGCGDIDLLGRRKPQSYYREALWWTGVLHVTVRRPLEPGQTEKVTRWGWPDCRSHWTWPGWEGRPLKVEVYSSCDRVRLTLNGRDLGEKPTGWKEQRKAEFEVPYSPGELKAIGAVGSKRVEFSLRTAGQPAGLRLIPDRARIQASRNDLSFVEIEVVDARGVVVPHAETPVALEVTGRGELAAVGNANPVDMASFQGRERKAWQGTLQAILRPTGKAGSITLTAKAEGLKTGTARIAVR